MRKNKVKNIVYNPDTKEGFIELSNNEKVNFSFDEELYSWFQWGASTETLTETQPIVEKLFKQFINEVED